MFFLFGSGRHDYPFFFFMIRHVVIRAMVMTSQALIEAVFSLRHRRCLVPRSCPLIRCCLGLCSAGLHQLLRCSLCFCFGFWVRRVAEPILVIIPFFLGLVFYHTWLPARSGDPVSSY